MINTRRPFVEFMQRPEIVKEEGWFGFEQEYWVTDRDGIPLGWQLDKDFRHDGKHCENTHMLSTAIFHGCENFHF